ncbi:zf-HC2 domain-containing protein [Streptomyces sp. NBC_01007]|nr:zf-HC2 domain-containing protein [Streptomyces sp. NBC_01007]WRZ96493.1 zf-HC2 domain-containing protein [Streptomyces sp. NBC_01007]WRZ96498.1 zf-HC2 domain-containing protein [Streptomyces sp. NBC_01007]WRZ96502.1 zf-HC2 domain-containing protein [Streptomyces sp. NBC_01007]
MRSLERHRDVGAYALGVLGEAEAFRFEDHLMECPRCTAYVSEFRPATRQLMLYRRSTPRTVHPFAAPGPRLLDRLLGEVATRNRAGRRRFLYALAASVVLAAGGPTIALVTAHGSPSDQVAAADPPANQMARTDAETGVWAQVSTRDRVWGSEIEVQVKDAKGPRSCELVAIGEDGSEQTVTSWMEPPHNGDAITMQGGSSMRTDEIRRFEVRTADGKHLVTLNSP